MSLRRDNPRPFRRVVGAGRPWAPLQVPSHCATNGVLLTSIKRGAIARTAGRGPWMRPGLGDRDVRKRIAAPMIRDCAILLAPSRRSHWRTKYLGLVLGSRTLGSKDARRAERHDARRPRWRVTPVALTLLVGAPLFAACGRSPSSPLPAVLRSATLPTASGVADSRPKSCPAPTTDPNT